MASDGIKAPRSKLDESLQRITQTPLGTQDGDMKFALDVGLAGGVCPGNSTTIPLLKGQTFTGACVQNAHPHVAVMLKTDQPGTLYFQFSSDGENWDSQFPTGGFRVSAGIAEFHTAVKLPRFYRTVFTNDDTADQTYLRLSTYFGSNFVPSVAPLNQIIGIDSDALSTRPTSFDDEVVIGLRSRVSHFTNFGYHPGLTAASGEQTIWAYTGGNFTPLTSASTFTIAYNNATDGLGTTGALTLYIQYVDSSGLKAEAVHTLSNTGSDVTTFSGLGINRIAVSSSGSAQINTNDITVTATTGGTVQAFVPALSGVTQQCIFYTDSNSYGVGKFLWINANKISGGSSPRITIKGYIFNRNVATRYEIFRYTIDTGVENTTYLSEPVGFRLSPTDVLYFVADTDTNNSTVGMRFSVREYKQS